MKLIITFIRNVPGTDIAIDYSSICTLEPSNHEVPEHYRIDYNGSAILFPKYFEGEWFTIREETQTD